MGIEFAWFYDVLLAVIFLYAVYLGSKRGFIRTVIILCGYVIAFVVGIGLSSAFAPTIYDKAFSPKITKTIDLKIEALDMTSLIKKTIDKQNYGVDISEEQLKEIITESNGKVVDNIVKYINENNGEDTTITSEVLTEKIKETVIYSSVEKIDGEVPDFVSTGITDIIRNNDEAMSNFIRQVVLNEKPFAEIINDEIIRPLFVPVLKIIIFLIVFIVIMVVIKILSSLFKGVNHIPIAGSLNKFLGGVIGFAQGAIMISLICILIKFAIIFSNNSMIMINQPVIEQTYIFKDVYNFINSIGF